MCGISGIFVRSNISDSRAENLQSRNAEMVRSQYSRGPDATDVWHSDHVYLGHSRLAIMDPENTAANQPVHTERWALVYNGEIYNFRELGHSLKREYHVTLQTRGDTEILLLLIDKLGVHEALRRVNGIFAFAAYDKQNDELFLARDRLGIKPVYYYLDSDAIWFASSPSAIAKARDRTWDLNYNALQSYFALGATCNDQTLFSGIQRLGASQVLQMPRSGVVTTETYWTPEWRDASLEDAFTNAILGQKESHVDSSVFLSGGVDSSVISVLLEDLSCFHLDSPETKYARYVADFLDSELEVSEYSGELDFQEFNVEYAQSCGEPSASAPIPLLVSKAMHAAGHKVAFSANGADELFFGYPRTPAAELHASYQPTNNYDDPPVQSAQEQRDHIFRAERSFVIPRAEQVGLPDQSFEQRFTSSPLSNEFPPSAHARWFELRTYVEHDLNPTLDFASMAYSLEVRVPFLDHLLIETALSKDANQFFSPDYGRKTPLKRFLKKAGLHPLVWSRPKIGFSVPPEAMQKRRASLRSSLESLRASDYLRLNKSMVDGSRDHQYLAAAADAFVAWKSVWVDSGLVRP